MTTFDLAYPLRKRLPQADNASEYEKAYSQYKKALEYFMTGLKHEKNQAVKDTIMGRVMGYMQRAETLKKVLDEQAKPPPGPKESGGGGGAAATAKKGDKESDGDKEMARLKSQLEGAIVTEKPNVAWDDVAGLLGAKEALKEAVILPRRFPQLFVGKRRPWRGILLYGPPGTGKSFLAKAVATEADAKFFAISSSDLMSKWQGESEKLVKSLFEMARAEAHAIIFIDEIDSMCGSRSEGESESSRRVKTEFLVQMQGVSTQMDGLLVLGATNVPWELDPAIRRRFEKRIYIPLPEANARATMTRLNLGDTPNSMLPANFDLVGARTDGFSGSDLSVLVREALMEPLRVCQLAKQFYPVPQAGSPHAMLMPCPKYPNCPRCPMLLSTMSEAATQHAKATPCASCGARRMSLYDVPPDALLVPVVDMGMFEGVLDRARKSVDASELQKFVDWTHEFGQEG
jgi:vacuolar protein-sorting-associated protein 4